MNNHDVLPYLENAYSFLMDPAIGVAIKEIKHLRQQKAELVEALQPFSKLFVFPYDLQAHVAEGIKSMEDWDENSNDMETEEYVVLRKDILNARAAIAKATGGE